MFGVALICVDFVHCGRTENLVCSFPIAWQVCLKHFPGGREAKQGPVVEGARHEGTLENGGTNPPPWA
jgi:hypothetical protein